MISILISEEVSLRIQGDFFLMSMPELPEVTTIVNQLKKEIVGAVIAKVESIEGYRTEPEINEFRKQVAGLTVTSVRRVAKTIVVELGSSRPRLADSQGEALWIVIHLAMTGRLLFRELESKPDPWTRLVFRLQPVGLNSTRRVGELRFCDARLFGSVRLVTRDKLQVHKKRYGPDALDPDLDPPKLLDQLKKRRTVVKRALLDQEIIAGIGNIYANEALWLAGVHPEVMSSQVTSDQAKSLLGALRQILSQSIEHRGSTLDDRMYVDLYGREGEHQNHFRIYGKAGQPCFRCQSKVEFKEIGGRGTFYCPECQVRSSLKVNLEKINSQQPKLL